MTAMTESGTEAKAAFVAKYRATERFEEALKIVAPSPDRHPECEQDVAEAFRTVKDAAKLDKSKPLTAVQHKKKLQKLAKTLRATIDVAAETPSVQFALELQRRVWPDNSLIEDLKRHLKVTEKAIDSLSKWAKKGSKDRSFARRKAVCESYFLLKKYGKEPTRHRDGDFYKLARELLGNQQSDLDKYVKRFWGLERLVVLSRLGG